MARKIIENEEATVKTLDYYNKGFNDGRLSGIIIGTVVGGIVCFGGRLYNEVRKELKEAKKAKEKAETEKTSAVDVDYTEA